MVPSHWWVTNGIQLFLPACRGGQIKSLSVGVSPRTPRVLVHSKTFHFVRLLKYVLCTLTFWRAAAGSSLFWHELVTWPQQSINANSANNNNHQVSMTLQSAIQMNEDWFVWRKAPHESIKTFFKRYLWRFSSLVINGVIWVCATPVETQLLPLRPRGKFCASPPEGDGLYWSVWPQ